MEEIRRFIEVLLCGPLQILHLNVKVELFTGVYKSEKQLNL